MMIEDFSHFAAVKSEGGICHVDATDDHREDQEDGELITMMRERIVTNFVAVGLCMEIGFLLDSMTPWITIEKVLMAKKKMRYQDSYLLENRKVVVVSKLIFKRNSNWCRSF